MTRLTDVRENRLFIKKKIGLEIEPKSALSFCEFGVISESLNPQNLNKLSLARTKFGWMVLTLQVSLFCYYKTLLGVNK